MAVIKRTLPAFVYELEKGWSFDGNYIPHYLELNWHWGERPDVYTGIHKVRIHGLAKGNAYLSVQMNGIETKYSSDGYSEQQYIDMLSEYQYVSSDFSPMTTYVDYNSRGLAVQMKFVGRNLNILKPEPSHVMQVLVLSTSPQGSGMKAN